MEETLIWWFAINAMLKEQQKLKLQVDVHDLLGNWKQFLNYIQHNCFQH